MYPWTKRPGRHFIDHSLGAGQQDDGGSTCKSSAEDTRRFSACGRAKIPTGITGYVYMTTMLYEMMLSDLVYGFWGYHVTKSTGLVSIQFVTVCIAPHPFGKGHVPIYDYRDMKTVN